MKTPREILLQQHAAISPKLDRLRTEAIASLTEERQDRSPATWSWRAFMLSLRWHFAAMSAAWVIIVGLNLTTSDHAAQVLAQNSTTPREERTRTIAEIHRLQAEINSVLASDRPATRQAVLPPRRSERRLVTAVV